MKVVLFCGGLGMRLKEYSEIIPKPMIKIGYRPILWYVMKYYAHFGHKDFILCLGYKADIIKNYFLNYNECLSNDFTLTEGGKKIALASSDIQDWKITFVDTGLHANIGHAAEGRPEVRRERGVLPGQLHRRLVRLPAARPHRHPQGEEQDGLFVSTRPGFTFHIVSSNGDGSVTDIKDVSKSEHLGERRLLRLPAVDLRRHRARRGARPGALPAAHRQEGADHLQARRVLPGHGHLQGEAAPRRHVRARRDALGGLEDGPPAR